MNQKAVLESVCEILNILATLFQLFIVRMGEIKQWNPTGMPKLARNLEELRNMLDGHIDAESLVANG